MENSSRVYNTVVKILCQHKNWLDIRHLFTLAWMMTGLILSESISLTAWTPYVLSRAKYAQSIVRRFQRWLNNPRINVHCLYAPLIKKALDTSTLWDKYCIIRISVIYRGRAIPVVWKVLEHKSSNVSYETYNALLDAVPVMLPPNVVVVFLADRGFADISLMSHVKKLGWHFRIRIKKNFWIYQDGCNPYQVSDLPLRPGECIFLHNVYITADKYGPVCLSLAHHSDNGELWYVASDEHTDINTFLEYGMRFDIEENFLDDKSNGFQLENSLIRSSDALSRLCFVISMATLYLVSQGTQVVSDNKRRWVDPHWFRGNSYLRIGWQWVKSALVHGWELCSVLCLSGQPDPEPAIASRRQANRKTAMGFKMLFYNDSA